jgi:hypothetical protein
MIFLIIASQILFGLAIYFMVKWYNEKAKVEKIKNFLETYGQDIGSWGGWSGIDGRNIKITILKMIEGK